MFFPSSSRLRDLSAQDKFEHQRVVKDLERLSAETNHLREQKEKLDQDIQVWVGECGRESVGGRVCLRGKPCN